ncbi:endopolyphosphatase [Aspergillus undulatus]|uniref:endopolyphosphatase n=1 Tax=Aspergillus undulatus TaxID=1810928 RepID=UPI003CCCC9BC
MILPRFLPALCGLSLVACASAVPITEQQVLRFDQDDRTESSRHLAGRFLHITDFHLDSNYEPGTSDERVCHWGNGSAGILGAEGTECDSPRTLIDETFRWIEKNLKGEIDFVLWTGDSARHDNDEKIPRTADEIIELNEVLAAKFIDLFEDGSVARGLSIPIIPTIGNNDIMPHNIFKEAPNRWTRKFTEVWASFIPEHQRHSFEEGGWFSADLIPNKLAAISLNTMYFYESNSAVDGCAAKSEPGYEHMEWLRVQFELLRERKMKAILIGHVPPARSGGKRSWDESCWQKYTLFANRFRDVVVGSVYGHMNVDHFMLQDSREVDLLNASEDSTANNDISVQSRSTYLSSLRDDWADMPSPPIGKSSNFLSDDWTSEPSDSIGASKLGKKERRFLKKIGGPYAERYSVSLVSPSVVPNYFPTLRVVEYNTTGLEGIKLWADTPYSPDLFEHFDWSAVKRRALDENPSTDNEDSPDNDNDMTEQRKKKKHKKIKNEKDRNKKKPNFKVPDEPTKSTPPGPAYSDQALTWLSYAQYYANLTEIYSESADETTSEVENTDKTFNLYQLEYDTRDDTVYNMKDLTVRSYFQLAKRIANNNLRKGDIYAEFDLQTDESEFESEPEPDSEGDDDDDDDDYPSEESTNKTNNKNKKDKKKSKNKNAHKKKHKNRVWRTFLDRAFVGFLSGDELDDI